MPSQPNPYFSTVPNPQSPMTPTTPGHSAQAFARAQQSLQARNKPFASPSMAESYEARQRRQQAVEVLESVELLIWFSVARNEVYIATPFLPASLSPFLNWLLLSPSLLRHGRIIIAFPSNIPTEYIGYSQTLPKHRPRPPTRLHRHSLARRVRCRRLATRNPR